jgi:hypothetical protein
VIVHTRIFAPVVRPVAFEIALLTGLITTPGDKAVQLPVPISGVLACNEEPVAQIVWSAPADAASGNASFCIITVDADGGHTPFVIVHSNTCCPKEAKITGVFAFIVEVTDAEPDSTDHVPLPTEGVFADKVADDAQTVWLLPAKDGVGGGSFTMVTVDDERGQVPLLMFHESRLLPADNPETTAVALPAGLTVPPPPSNSQLPVPIAGTFALNVAEEAQTVWSDPAFETVGGRSRAMFTVEDDGAHTPFEIVHCAILSPAPRLVMVAAGLAEGVMTADPCTTDQLPEPIAGVLALSDVEILHTVCPEPARETDGG